MQYKFRDLDETINHISNRLCTVINGVNIDNAIDGFETLSISGRELIGRDIETRNFKSTNARGSKRTSRSKGNTRGTNQLLSSSFSNRMLKIKYRLLCKDDLDQRRKFEDLNYLINLEEVKISFTDDPRYYYIGTFSQSSELDGGLLNVVGEFEFVCIDHHKYQDKSIDFKFTKTGTYKYINMYPPQIEKIKIKIKQLIDKIRLTNETSGDFIEFVDIPLYENEEITIDLIKNETMLISEVRFPSGYNLDPYLNIFSELEDFTLNHNDVISTDKNADVEITFRNKRL